MLEVRQSRPWRRGRLLFGGGVRLRESAARGPSAWRALRRLRFRPSTAARHFATLVRQRLGLAGRHAEFKVALALLIEAHPDLRALAFFDRLAREIRHEHKLLRQLPRPPFFAVALGPTKSRW